MTAKEIENNIKFEKYGVDSKTDSTLFRATFQLDYFARISNSEMQSHPEEVREYVRRNLSEEIMRKLYDDQRESLYKAIYDLRKANPMDFEEQRKAHDALLEAALRQPAP